MKYTVSFTAWYLNPDRICQLIKSKSLLEHIKGIRNESRQVFALSSEGLALAAIKDELENWLRENPIPTLGEILATNKPLKEGDLFTIYHDFYGRGLSKYGNSNEPLPRTAIAEIHNLLKYDQKRRLRIFYSPSNLTSATAWSRLSGRTRLFCFCYVERVSATEIIAHPYMIGDPHASLELNLPTSWDAGQYGEVHVSQIDQFSRIRSVYEAEKATPHLEILKSIPERLIKFAFAEIINEGKIPKDWSGEQSDLFSCNVSVTGKYMSAAFLFKGPARFSEMKMTHLGKNGDQIVRLFSEPAQLLVLQHCHNVSNAVRSTMRAFASRIHDLRYFSIINGYDTLRLLSAYKKCGI